MAIAGREVGLPRSIDEVDERWMTEVLRISGAIDAATSVSSLQSTQFAVGAGLLSLLYRTELGYDGGAGPATVIVKLPIDHPVQRGIADGLGFYPREIRFYTEVAPKSSITVPHVHAALIAEDSSDFVVVMEDLSGRPMADQRVGATWAQVLASVDAMAAFHAGWYGSPDLDGLTDTFLPMENPIYLHALPGVFMAGWPLAKERAAHILTPELVAFGDRYVELLPFFLSQANSPATLVHGDWRLDNLFFADGDDGGEVTVIDFQITGMGAGAYDLGYFVSQSVAPEVRAGREIELIDRYLARLAERGVTLDRDAAIRSFKIAVAQCFIYGVSGFPSYDDLPERSQDLIMLLLDRAGRAILDLDAIAELPD
jgi:hypothetical protein